ncbi:MAG: site-specific integrase, partial [Acidimicrobiales bacterium]
MQLTATTAHRPSVMSPTPRVGYRNTQPNLGTEPARPRRARHNRTRTQPHTASAERRRIFVTDAIMNGLPPHIAQVICGHANINTTLGYKAIYPAE